MKGTRNEVRGTRDLNGTRNEERGTRDLNGTRNEGSQRDEVRGTRNEGSQRDEVRGTRNEERGTKKKEEPLAEKTYGMKGLTECHVELDTGNPVMPVIKLSFTGGQITGYGVIPATFTTRDRLVQRWIEESKLFKNDRIIKVKTRVIPEEELDTALVKKRAKEDLEKGNDIDHSIDHSIHHKAENQ